MPPAPTPSRDACYQWLLSACRGWLVARAGRTGEAQSIALPRALDWTTLEAMARYQGLEPILHDLVVRHPAIGSEVPDTLRATWERVYYGIRIRNSEALNLLSRILERCDEAGVSVLVLKGPSVLAEVYGDIGLRPMVDLDVLCRPGDLLVLRDVVTALGFSAAGPPYLHTVSFYCDAHEVLLELHFDLYDFVAQKTLFLTGAWKNGRVTSIEEWSFPVLPPEHQIVFELSHWVWHRFALDLRHVVDFAGRLLLNRGTVDKARLSRLLADTGLEEQYSLLVGALSSMLDIPLDQSRDVAAAAGLQASFQQHLLERSSAIGFVQGRRTGLGFRHQQGLARKAAFAWKRLVPPMMAMRAAYNLRTPMQAWLGIPLHLARTMADLYSRARSGF
jgi:hypothetical protein